MQIKKRLIALVAGISLLTFGMFMSCENPNGVDNKDETEITNTNDSKDKEKNNGTGNTSDKDKKGDNQNNSGKENNSGTDSGDGKDNTGDNNSETGKENAGENSKEKENGGEAGQGDDADTEETVVTVSGTPIKIKNSAAGIKFEWGELPENTTLIEIQTWYEEWKSFVPYYRYESPSDNSFFLDEYVTAGDEYKYKIYFINSTSVENKNGKEINVKAKGGKGERSINIEATEEGIKLSGEKYFKLEESLFGFFKNEKGVLVPRNPSSIYSFTTKTFEYVDNYVDADTEYEYRAVEAYGGNIVYPRYKKQTVKAIGGDGFNQLKLSAEATDKGIKFTWEGFSQEKEIRSIRLMLHSLDSRDNLQIILHDNKALSFVAEYVDVNKTYNCQMEIDSTDKTSFYSNVAQVTTTGGSGEGKLLNNPAATFDGGETIHFTVVPEISLPAKLYASCDFEYYDSQTRAGGGCLYDYYPGSSGSDVKIWSDRHLGSWTLSECYKIHFNGEEYEYSNCIYDVSQLDNIPQIILLTADTRFSLIATPVADGIKLEWKNLPEGTKSLKIEGLYREDNGEHYRDIFTLFEINNLSDVSSVIDKYVDSGKIYSYRLSALNENSMEMGRAYARDITATSGSGEKKFTATAESDGIHITCEKPSSDYSILIWKRLAEKQRECNEWFDLGMEEGIADSITDIVFKDSFVNAGVEYVYSPVLELKSKKQSDIIEYPRYKIVKVKANSTGKKPVITNQPVGTYNETAKELTVTTAPAITQVEEVKDWHVQLDYYNNQYGTTYGLFSINDSLNNYCVWNGAYSGSWNLCGYRIWLCFDNYVRYHVENSDISCLDKLPQTVKL